MYHRVIQIRPTSRAATVAVATGVIVVGGALVVVGATLLLALGVVAGTVGAGVVAWRRLTGQRGMHSPETTARARALDPTLDPSLEIFPESEPDVKRLPPTA